MSIEYSVLIKEKKITEAILIKKLQLMGYSCNMIEKLSKGINIDLNEAIGFSVYLIDVDNYPYNSFDTIFEKEEFIFQQILGFRYIKEYDDLQTRYNTMLTLIFDIIIELQGEAIFIDSNDTEVCLFKGESKICLMNKSGIWDRNFFRNIIKDKEVIYFEDLEKIKT